METIKYLGSRRRLIYYPEIAWFLPQNRTLYTREEIEFLIKEHLQKIKCLALLFDHIIFPPSSLLIISRVIRGLTSNTDIVGLLDAGVIITTYWTWCRDSQDFLPRKLEFLSNIVGFHLHVDDNIKRVFKIFHSYARDVVQQNQWAKEELFQFLNDNREVIINNYGKKALSQLWELAKRSEYSESIPYSLEKFGILLRREETLPAPLRKEIEDRCWGFYFEGGVTGNYCVRYPVAEVDHKMAEHLIYDNVFGGFFSPSFLEIFLEASGIYKPQKIWGLNYKDILSLRSEKEWEEFTKVYFEIARSLSSTLEEAFTWNERYKVFREGNIEKFCLLIRSELIKNRFGRFDKHLKDMAALLSEAGGLVGIPFLPFLNKKLRLEEKIEALALTLKSPSFVSFRDKLNEKLRSVGPK